MVAVFNIFAVNEPYQLPERTPLAVRPQLVLNEGSGFISLLRGRPSSERKRAARA